MELRIWPYIYIYMYISILLLPEVKTAGSEMKAATGFARRTPRVRKTGGCVVDHYAGPRNEVSANAGPGFAMASFVTSTPVTSCQGVVALLR